MAARLFSYTIPVDDGAAPNPFFGMCTLAICKPAIRRVAKEGDWVVGLGSKNAPSGDFSGKVVYAIKVTQVISLEEYDERAQKDWPHRIPDVKNKDEHRRLGDCIYDFSSGKPRQRDGVHGPGNVETDLGGENALISNNFYYFGNRPVPLPQELIAICHQTRGHRSKANDPYVTSFVRWIQGFGMNSLNGEPDYPIDWPSRSKRGCEDRRIDGECDKEC